MTDYLCPTDLDEALHAMAGGRRILAGGTDLFAMGPQMRAGPVLDISALPSLRGITWGQGLRIGAAATWDQIATASLPPSCRALQMAARMIGGRQVQNAGTIGGNLCNASPAADGVPPLLILNAQVELASLQGVRHLPLHQFLIAPRRTALRPDEILVALHVADSDMRGASRFLKLGARQNLVISIALVAVRAEVHAGQIVSAQVAVGSCSGVAQRLPGVEAALRGAPVAQAAQRVHDADPGADLTPLDDIRATAAYRRTAARTLICRALAQVLA